jgi:hypothetical protein
LKNNRKNKPKELYFPLTFISIVRKYLNAIAFFALLTLVSVLIVFSLSIILDLSNHQPENPHVKYVHLDYPSDIILPASVYTHEGILDNPLLFSADIYLIYDEPLVEGTIVTVKGVGLLYPNGQKVIGSFKNNNTGEIFHNAAIGGFREAFSFNKSSPHDTKYNFNGAFPILFKNSSMPLAVIPDKDIQLLPIIQQIHWENQGDYLLYVLFPYSNGTSRIFLFDDNKIHVNGPEIMWQEKFSEINTWLSIVLLVFTVITTIKLLSKMGRKMCSDFSILQNHRNENKNSPTKDRLQ